MGLPLQIGFYKLSVSENNVVNRHVFTVNSSCMPNRRIKTSKNILLCRLIGMLSTTLTAEAVGAVLSGSESDAVRRHPARVPARHRACPRPARQILLRDASPQGILIFIS